MSFLEAYRKSIKSLDTEEKLDLYFYRLFGFAVAQAASRLNITPSHLTFMGLATGVLGGGFYYHNTSAMSLALGTTLFILSGIFDSADGQLARMTGRFTKMGLILDGICDTLVFVSIYFFSLLPLMSHYGVWIIVIGTVAGICHSFQSATLDFYNREYLYFGHGKIVEGDYWNPSLREASEVTRKANGFWEKWLLRMRYNWLSQQYLVATRTDDDRARMKAMVLGPRSIPFQNTYRELNRNVLRFWCLLGANFHTLMIILFVFLRRFDLYLLLVDILFLNMVMLGLRYFQRDQDCKLLAWMNAAETTRSGPSLPS